MTPGQIAFLRSQVVRWLSGLSFVLPDRPHLTRREAASVMGMRTTTLQYGLSASGVAVRKVKIRHATHEHTTGL